MGEQIGGELPKCLKCGKPMNHWSEVIRSYDAPTDYDGGCFGIKVAHGDYMSGLPGPFEETDDWFVGEYCAEHLIEVMVFMGVPHDTIQRVIARLGENF